MYKQCYDNLLNRIAPCVQRLEDNAFIPFDEQNTDYIAYLKWLEEGGIPIPADEVTV
jgi:cytochrome c